jgi:hypothetical protein
MRLGIPRKCGRDLLCEAGDAPGPSQEVSCSATIKSKANSATAAASATVSITGRPQLVQIALEAGAPRAEFKRNPSSRDHRGDTWQTHSVSILGQSSARVIPCNLHLLCCMRKYQGPVARLSLVRIKYSSAAALTDGRRCYSDGWWKFKRGACGRRE